MTSLANLHTIVESGFYQSPELLLRALIERGAKANEVWTVDHTPKFSFAQDKEWADFNAKKSFVNVLAAFADKGYRRSGQAAVVLPTGVKAAIQALADDVKAELEREQESRAGAGSFKFEESALELCCPFPLAVDGYLLL